MEYGKVNSLAGSGKTFAAERWGVKFAAKAGRKICIVQPSKNLIDQTFNEIQEYMSESGIQCRVSYFYSDDTGLDRGSVKQRIMGYLGDVDSVGEIIIITQSAFLTLPYFHKKENWTVVVDEIPGVDRSWDFKLPKTHTVLTEHLYVEDHDPIHYRVIPATKSTLSELQKNADNDDVWGMFSELAGCILNDHWSVYVRKDQWIRHLSGDTEHGRHTLNFFGMLEASIFDGYDDIVVMGAMFDESMMNLYWTTKGVEFQEFEAISSRARYTQHTNGELITFKYITDEDWSKRTRDTLVNGTAILDDAVARIQKEMDGKDFIWVGNNDIGDVFGKNVDRLPGISNGMNKYQDIDHIVFLSALNRSPAHFAFLKHQGLDPEYVKFATSCQSAYQAIMRCSIRDPKNMNPKTVIVPDARTAEYLAAYFEGCHIGPLSGLIKKTKVKTGRKTINGEAFTGAERQVRLRADKRRKLLKELIDLLADQKCNESTIREGVSLQKNTTDLRAETSTEYAKVSIQLFDSIYSTEAENRFRYTNDELIAQLRETHEVTGRTFKKSNFLVAAAIFDPNKAVETKRGKANIEFVTGIWFDIDGGDLTPHEFRKMFPDLRVVTFNTFSGGNRWRAYFPTSQIMTVAVHQIIIRSIERVVIEAGYHDDKTASKMEQYGRSVLRNGFDTSKFVASSLFYAPMASVNEDDGFFHDFPGKEIDPMQWVRRAVIHDHDEDAETITPLQFECDEPVIETDDGIEHKAWDGSYENCYFKPHKKIAMYESLPEHSGDRYTGIFTLALSFRRSAELAGHDITESQVVDFIREVDGGYHDGQGGDRIKKQVANAFNK